MTHVKKYYTKKERLFVELSENWTTEGVIDFFNNEFSDKSFEETHAFCKSIGLPNKKFLLAFHQKSMGTILYEVLGFGFKK